MDYGRGRKTHRPRAIPAWRVKTDFNGGAVDDAATSETLGLPLEEARELLQASREINRILGRSALSGRCRHVRGPINVIRAFLPHFRANKGGMFINISSFMGVLTAMPTGSLYNMSKFALEGLTEGLYYELKPLNIELRLIERGGSMALRNAVPIEEYLAKIASNFA